MFINKQFVYKNEKSAVVPFKTRENQENGENLSIQSIGQSRENHEKIDDENITFEPIIRGGNIIPSSIQSKLYLICKEEILASKIISYEFLINQLPKEFIDKMIHFGVLIKLPNESFTHKDLVV